MTPGLLRTAGYLSAILATLAVSAGTAGYAWRVSGQSTEAQRAAVVERANAVVGGLAAAYAAQITSQILALDQTLETMARDWEADPTRFDLDTRLANAKVLTGIARDVYLTDDKGIIRQSSVPEYNGQSVGDMSVFRQAAEQANEPPRLLLGGALVDPFMRQWHLDAARALRNADGSFAGILNTDYRLAAVTGVFEAARPPGNGFAALINLTEGKMRVAFGPATVTPDASIADTPMFGVVDSKEAGLWIGPSAADAVVRAHAFQRIKGYDLAVVAGLDEQEILAPAIAWGTLSRHFSIAISVLSGLIAIGASVTMWRRRRRGIAERENRAALASAAALAEVSRAQADALSRRLRATFTAVTDGLAIFDAHLNLIEWNDLFHERAGVNTALLRTGIPIEDILLIQAQAGAFGEGVEAEAEAARLAALLRAGNFDAMPGFRIGGRSIEFRCRPLAEGGFVALYTDVTDARRERQSFQEIRDRLGVEFASRGRFLSAIGYEIRDRTVRIARAAGLLGSLSPTQAQADALVGVLAAAISLENLARDTAEVPLLEQGAVTFQPELVAIQPMLREVTAALRAEARERGVTIYLTVDEAAPAELIADAGRLRQIVTALVSEAARIAVSEGIWLTASAGTPEDGGTVALRLTVRAFGPPPQTDGGDAVFRPFSAVAAPDGDHRGTGLGLAVADNLTRRIGGTLHHGAWATVDGRTGNDFVLTLPQDLLPGHAGRAPGQAPADGRASPRTRVLMVGYRTGLRLAAATMLRRDGHMVETIETVADAVRRMARVPFDVIFADTAQSGMTFDAAVIAIRGAGGPAQSVPLIALAPPHTEAQARTWRAAGADDILPAVPSFAELADAIRCDVWAKESPAGAFGSMIPWHETSEEGIPILSADRVEELRVNIPADELNDMVEESIGDLFRRLPALRRALAGEAGAAITAQAHAMVGIAGGYGMAVLEARLRAIQAAVRENRLHTIQGAAAVVEADLTRASGALRRAVRRSGDGLSQPVEARVEDERVSQDETAAS